MGTGGCINFHMHDIITHEVFSTYILLKVMFRRKVRCKEKFYVYRWTNQKNIEQSPVIPTKYKDTLLRPYNSWQLVYSF